MTHVITLAETIAGSCSLFADVNERGTATKLMQFSCSPEMYGVSVWTLLVRDDTAKYDAQ